jgi:tRNA G18 (ribose-2'-O)-methylase SpoU
MYGSTQSLNVSVATGILLNHIAQKHKGEKW